MESEVRSTIPISNYDAMDIDETILASTIHKADILDDVAHSDAFFKSQQRGEKDLTFEEKRSIAEDLLDKNKVIFLQRYWKYIKVQDISFFDDVGKDYEIGYYLEEIKKLSDSKKSQAQIRNRRYEAMKKMISEGSYFSEDEMKHRNPFLYDRLVGRHLTESERYAAKRKETCGASFSGFLMDQIDHNYMNCLSRMQEDAEECTLEENDEDTEEEEENHEDDLVLPSSSNLPDDEKKKLRSEFTNIMYESFLSGNDKEFDYSSVDNNVEYDSIQEREVDEEEKYFDADSS